MLTAVELALNLHSRGVAKSPQRVTPHGPVGGVAYRVGKSDTPLSQMCFPQCNGRASIFHRADPRFAREYISNGCGVPLAYILRREIGETKLVAENIWVHQK
jgi:hypothetical protein